MQCPALESRACWTGSVGNQNSRNMRKRNVGINNTTHPISFCLELSAVRDGIDWSIDPSHRVSKLDCTMTTTTTTSSRNVSSAAVACSGCGGSVQIDNVIGWAFAILHSSFSKSIVLEERWWTRQFLKEKVRMLLIPSLICRRLIWFSFRDAPIILCCRAVTPLVHSPEWREKRDD